MQIEIDELEVPPQYIYLDDIQEELEQNGFQIEEPNNESEEE